MLGSRSSQNTLLTAFRPLPMIHLGYQGPGGIRMGNKIEISKSQSFTFGEAPTALEIMKFAMRCNVLTGLAQRPDFVSVYRKFAGMKEKLQPLASGSTDSNAPQAE